MLIGMKSWALYLIGLGLVVLAFLLMRSNSPKNLLEYLSGVNGATTTQGEAQQQAAPTPARDEALHLRQQYHLRALTGPEEGKPVQELPNGIYGFAQCGVASLRSGPADPKLLEIHKHADGIVYYVGFTSDEHIGKYLAREKNFHILMSPRPSDKASSLLMIPVEFVFKCETRPAKDGQVFDLFVASIPELQS